MEGAGEAILAGVEHVAREPLLVRPRREERDERAPADADVAVDELAQHG